MDTHLCIAFEEHYFKLAYWYVFFLINIFVIRLICLSDGNMKDSLLKIFA